MSRTLSFTRSLALSSASEASISRRIESWMPHAGGRSLQRTYGFCDTASSLPIGDLQERFRSHRAVQAALPEQIAAVAASFATPSAAAAFLLDKF